MTSEPDLVALLYRADWTRLSLSAEVHRVSTRALRGVPWGHEGQAPGSLRTRPPLCAEPGTPPADPDSLHHCRLVYCFVDGRVDHNICRCR